MITAPQSGRQQHFQPHVATRLRVEIGLRRLTSVQSVCGHPPRSVEVTRTHRAMRHRRIQRAIRIADLAQRVGVYLLLAQKLPHERVACCLTRERLMRRIWVVHLVWHDKVVREEHLLRVLARQFSHLYSVGCVAGCCRASPLAAALAMCEAHRRESASARACATENSFSKGPTAGS